MLALLKSKLKKDDSEEIDHLDTSLPTQDFISGLDEERIRKRIADKLERYRPIEREANFTGPKYFKNLDS